MKTNRPKSLLFYLFLLSSSFGLTQETITITLFVDSANFNASDLYMSCSLQAVYSESGNVMSSNGDLENFTIDARVDDTIIWMGESTSNNDIIDINRISGENGTQIFMGNENYGKRPNGSNKDIVEGKIIFDTENKADFKYKIFFKINGTDQSYKIAPKIRVCSN